jgi:protein RecA
MTSDRPRLKKRGSGNGAATPHPTGVACIPSGCTLLDLVLGGGWAEKRIANIVGDKSAGKTLLAIEASANFIHKYPKGRVKYREAESAFDRPYAKILGMPIDRVDFGDPINTVEELFSDLSKSVRSSVPTLYIVDSLDALSDEAELDRDLNEPTYGTEKARKLSQLFRRLVRQMASSNHTVIIISQIRSRIGGFGKGRTTVRAGGRALDFYASQVVFLSHMGAITRVVDNVKRPVGLHIRAKCDKNKVGLPLREADFTLQFMYGIDDLVSCVTWLREINRLDDIGVGPKGTTSFIRDTNSLAGKEYVHAVNRVQNKVRDRWRSIETTFLPKRRKYGEAETR